MRSFVATNLVQLPRVNAASGIALGASMETTYKSVSVADVPKGTVAAATRLFQALDDLRRDYAARIAEMAPASDELRATDVEIDACWSALDSLLFHSGKLPVSANEESLKDRAKEMRGVLFPEGLKFILLPYKQEWAESQARIDLIDARGFGPDIEALGGKALLAALRRSHLKYGDLQNLSKLSQVVVHPDVRAKLEAFSNALREYVVKVSAIVDPDVEGSEELADTLLAPVQTWQSSANNGATKGVDGEPAPGEPAPAPPVPPAPPAPAAPVVAAPSTDSPK